MKNTDFRRIALQIKILQKLDAAVLFLMRRLVEPEYVIIDKTKEVGR